MKTFLLLVVFFLNTICLGQVSDVLIEAESFEQKGGWVVDPQFVEQMGSPYLLAHGLGKPVEDAGTSFRIIDEGIYYFWVRTKNWAVGDWEPPGKFRLKIDNYTFDKDLGTIDGWTWQEVGKIQLTNGIHNIVLIDLTGFDGRCDAIFLSTNNTTPPSEQIHLTEWRKNILQLSANNVKVEQFDLVVVGGGIAGCSAAIAAAELGIKVALIHDRPVLGGNASGEIRVHTLGIYGHFERILKMLDTEHYPNGSPKAIEEDKNRMANVIKYKNISLFLNWKANNAFSENNEIKFVDAQHTSTGEQIRFSAPLFADCTGDGWIGYWAGAEYMYGRESVDKFGEEWEMHGELWSPDKADQLVMGSSLLWRSEIKDTAVVFPKVPWAQEVSDTHSAANGEWQWEFSRNDLHQIEDAEYIRDHMLRAIYGSFYNEKQKDGRDSLGLQWVSYIAGKRESRRLVGDHIYTFNDVRNNVNFPDSVVVETREVDVHYQQNLIESEKPDFLSRALFYRVDKYYVPYRSLYSKNINNLFMAGRCFSCSHIGLGGPRVMRTTGQMGAAVGYASVICDKYNISPREVYEKYLAEYMKLILSSNEQTINN